MHFANRRRHLLDGADFFDNETMRQETLIDKLHHAFIARFKPDCRKCSRLPSHVCDCDLNHFQIETALLAPWARKSPRSETLFERLTAGREQAGRIAQSKYSAATNCCPFRSTDFLRADDRLRSKWRSRARSL